MALRDSKMYDPAGLPSKVKPISVKLPSCTNAQMTEMVRPVHRDIQFVEMSDANCTTQISLTHIDHAPSNSNVSEGNSPSGRTVSNVEPTTTALGSSTSSQFVVGVYKT